MIVYNLFYIGLYFHFSVLPNMSDIYIFIFTFRENYCLKVQPLEVQNNAPEAEVSSGLGRN